MMHLRRTLGRRFTSLESRRYEDTERTLRHFWMVE